MHAIRAEDRSFPRLSRRQYVIAGVHWRRVCPTASSGLHGRLILTPPPCSPQTQQQGEDARAAAAIHLSHPRTQGTTPCTRCSTPPHSAVSSITRLARGVTLQGRGFAPRAMNRGGAKLAVSWSFAGVQRCRLASVRLACYVSDRSTCWFATATVH